MSSGLIQVAGIGSIIVLFAAVLFVIFIVASGVRIVKEYERGVIFRLGRVQGGAKGPGLFFLIPVMDKMVNVDLRTVTMDVPPQDVITRDNVPARVNAVVYFRVLDPNKSVIEVENYVLATSQISQTTLRSVLGQKDLDDLLSDRESINEELQTIIDEQTDPWGVKVSVVEVKDVEIPQGMQRSMAGQAQAERERRGASMSAPGEEEGRRGRGKGRGDSPGDATVDGGPGPGRAGEAGEDHLRRRRVPGFPAPPRRRREVGESHGFAAEALPDADGDLQREQLDGDPAGTHGPLQALPRRLERLRRRTSPSGAGGRGGAGGAG